MATPANVGWMPASYRAIHRAIPTGMYGPTDWVMNRRSTSVSSTQPTPIANHRGSTPEA